MFNEALVAQERKDDPVTRRLWVRSPLEAMNDYLLIFSSLSQNPPRQNPGVELRHSTYNASNSSAESGERSVLTLGSFYLIA